jgi:hypothetical protein
MDMEEHNPSSASKEYKRASIILCRTNIRFDQIDVKSIVQHAKNQKKKNLSDADKIEHQIKHFSSLFKIFARLIHLLLQFLNPLVALVSIYSSINDIMLMVNLAVGDTPDYQGLDLDFFLVLGGFFSGTFAYGLFSG